MDPWGRDNNMTYKRREFELEKQKLNPYLINRTLVADEELFAFDIVQPMGGQEWHVITSNQIRILEELRDIKRCLYAGQISPGASPYSYPPLVLPPPPYYQGLGANPYPPATPPPPYYPPPPPYYASPGQWMYQRDHQVRALDGENKDGATS
ncbi:hypothetical protein Sjap_017630 [Stephania japonica]|uniref:Uncharacterized protein n=1 Tax=Stephania japonica TaxID=461633 RepID=A0AAP0NKM0_9MAGN